MFNSDISIDLGTATAQVYIKNKGVVLSEPTVIAVNTDTNEVCAVGDAALEMLGRTPPFIQAVRPLHDGVISSFTLASEMIKAFLSKILAKTIGHPRIMMCVPGGVTDVEQRAVIEAAREVGARDIYIIEEPVAAALGAGFDISRSHGTLVVDIGGGTTDIAVISLGGVVVSRSLKIAGDEFSEAIEKYMKREKNLLIGPRTADNVKKKIGTVVKREDNPSCEVKGICSITGLPGRMEIYANDLCHIFDDYVYNITERIKEVLEETPPDLHSDIIEDGIIMTGGGALINGLDRRISEVIGVKCTLAEDIVNCVVKGAGIALEEIDSVTDITHLYHKKAYIRD
ncbi:MAG: rod shape-determining protein [Clostridiales bacterium]|nr:rod shape-determining protein [Clostridiales bacterium]